ncbi:MAG TPA: gliding motility-associated ABC transporter ATP-binding subunit GldA [Cyclobacteriaceae bacterium]|nr:gliding motility-associated ABC transporter ATP-binding subunit GldA [Cyclobacteriaceae bacterium]
MSIEVNNLSKNFGQQKAVDDISFKVRPGEITGFLGPNGAGKSTTMKILTGYIPPSGGSASVAGKNVMLEPMEVKARTGYLPEHNPLYLEMYVHEYLRFVAGIYQLSNTKQKTRIPEIITMCGLSKEQNKKIEELSKGYRQRVGLAQALIHDPEVLILDEPTSGLDPNQLVEIRKLVKEISANKTVIFSTHILQEVEALCDRVIVINKGKIVANDALGNLMKGGNSVQVEFERAVDEQELKNISGVSLVVKLDDRRYRLSADSTADIRSWVTRFAFEKNLPLVELRQEKNSLEAVFSELTLNNDKDEA